MSLIAASAEALAEGKHAALADLHFLLTLDESIVNAAEKQTTKAQLLEGIQENKMSIYYQHCIDTLGWTLDATLLKSMQEDNAKELAAIDLKLKTAQDNDADTDVMYQHGCKSEFLFRIGHKEEALAVVKTALEEKHVSTGQKIDLELKCIRIALFHSDTELLKEHIELCRTLIDEGGDWDRRNRLKVYDGAYRILIRDFKTAASYYMSSIATFTSYEVMEYSTFIQRTVYLGLFDLPRSELKEKIINSPDVRQVVRDVEDVKNFVESLYNCDYKLFNSQLLIAYKTICRDRLMAKHVSYYVKEMRVRAYNQFLEAYKSVTISSMAKSFGVSIDFIDGELFRFISMGRLNAKIDKTAGIIETNRPDAKNAQYHSVIKHGDALLNQIQRLARVVN